MRHWLGIDALELEIARGATDDQARILALRAEFARKTTALAAELLVAKRTTTQRAADTDAESDPHLGGM